MSSLRASSARMHDEQNTSLHEHGNGAALEPPRSVNGSLVAKLFAKATLPLAAVGVDEQVEARENGVNDGDSTGFDNSMDDARNGNGYGDGADVKDQEDDEDDDEYDPNEASDAEHSDDSDDSGSDLDDEETSMRSLLLPMATYAKQLLFLSDEEDNGEFDEQDAELWASGQDKHAWIARYEAANRAFEQKYGCRIDSPAIPEVKRKLRRERKREGKYSIVLVVLAVAYFIRLMVGGPASTITPTPPLTTVETKHVEATEASVPTHAHAMDVSHPLGWTSWTENVVVRVVTWPAQYFTAQTTTVVEKQTVKSREEGTTPPLAASTIDPSTEPAVAEKTPPANVVVQEKKEIAHVETSVQQEDTTQNVAVEGVVDEKAETATTVEVVMEVEIEVVAPSTVGETPATPALPGNMEQNAVTTPSVAPETEFPVAGSDVVTTEPPAEDMARQPATPGLLSQCSELFYKVIKTKNDADLKNAAIEACDAAVHASAAEEMLMERIQAHVIRGDLQSLLYSFEEARGDYEAAIAHSQTSDLVAVDARATMELKLAANRWIELYQTKQFKALRSECERVVASGDLDGMAFATTTSDHMRGVASEWLRVFKRETKLMDVLIKTRAWTISPLKMQ